MALYRMDGGCVGRVMNGIRDMAQNRNRFSENAVHTGYEELDRELGGMYPGEVYLTGGRPAMGKSRFAYNILYRRCIKNKEWVLLLSPEEKAETVIRNMLTLISEIDLLTLRENRISPRQLAEYETAAEMLCDASLLIEDSQYPGVDDLIESCRRIKRNYPVKLAIIDSWEYICMPSAQERRDDKQKKWVIDVFRKLKQAAQDLELVIIVNMKLKREVEERGDHYPRLEDFPLPAEVIDEAAGMLTLYRQKYYESRFLDEKEEKGESFEIRVYRDSFLRSKRNSVSEIRLKYNPDKMVIEDESEENGRKPES